MSVRPVKDVRQTNPTIEGAGVKLPARVRLRQHEQLDPFLLLYDFRNENPARLPGRLSRGIRIADRDDQPTCLPATSSTGTVSAISGSLGAGDVQWMTAGRGILHQEMPRGDPQGRLHGFQLWANLPASLKMSGPPLPGHPRARHSDVGG